MLTSTDAHTALSRPRPSYRRFDVSVVKVQRLSTTFTRVTFTGPGLHDFGTAGLDQRVKVVLPLPNVGMSPFPRGESWHDAWRRLPTELRNPIRTYTVRQVRPEIREVDIDFVTHGDAGPASRWVGSAAVGDEIAIVGPDELGENPRSGIEWRPGAARTILIAGDETAAPAIFSILAALPSDVRGAAFIEVPEESDKFDTHAPNGVEVTWLPRANAKAGPRHGAALESAVRDWTAQFTSDRQPRSELADVDIEREILWEVPAGTALDGELYAWLAGEASVIKSLRRLLVSETGVDRRQVAFMGYWRHGRSELN